MLKTTSPSYSISLRIEIPNRPGMLGKVVSAVGKAGGNIGAVDIAGFRGDYIIRDIVANARDTDMLENILNAVKNIQSIRILRFARKLPLK